MSFIAMNLVRVDSKQPNRRVLPQVLLSDAFVVLALQAGKASLFSHDVGVFWVLVRFLACGATGLMIWVASTGQLQKKRSIEVCHTSGSFSLPQGVLMCLLAVVRSGHGIALDIPQASRTSDCAIQTTSRSVCATPSFCASSHVFRASVIIMHQFSAVWFKSLIAPTSVSHRPPCAISSSFNRRIATPNMRHNSSAIRLFRLRCRSLVRGCTRDAPRIRCSTRRSSCLQCVRPYTGGSPTVPRRAFVYCSEHARSVPLQPPSLPTQACHGKHTGAPMVYMSNARCRLMWLPLLPSL